LAKYQFTSVLDTFTDSHDALARNGDDAAKKKHDQAVYAAIMKPLQEVKDFYDSYAKMLKESHLQCKSNMDAIENTIKKTQGKPSPAELKLLAQSQDVIQKFVDAIARDFESALQKDMMDWRGSWDKVCAASVFDTKMLQSILAYRKQLIDTQAKDWNPQKERIHQYLTRANTLMVAVNKAAKGSPGKSGGEDLKKLALAHTDAMTAGAKPVISYIDTVANELPRWKDEAKKGIDPKDKPNAAKIWSSKQGKIDQFEAYRKGLSGASKTLEMLAKSVAAGTKTADKTSAAEWAELKKKIEVDQKKVAAAEKDVAELIKYGDKVAELYKKATKG